MIYLRIFDEHSEYEAYSGSSEMTNPNVSACRHEGPEGTAHFKVDVIHVENVTLNKNLVELTSGETEQLVATITPSNAKDKTVVWSSSNDSVATVSQSGLITAVGEGTGTVITVTTNDGGYTASCAVEVTVEHVTGVTLNKQSVSLNIGDEETLIATVLPNDATDKSVSWASSDNTIATVTSGGVVRAVGEGNAVITVTTNDRGLTASCTVSASCKNYLTFVAKEDGTFSFSGSSTANTVSYSLNSGETWTALADGTNTPTVASGDVIMWKSSSTPSGSNGVGTFTSSGNFDVEGNVMSLLYNDEFEGKTSLSGKNGAFRNLFSGCTTVINAEHLELPATTLSLNCYREMFGHCPNLVTAPELPATTLGGNSYNGMFYNCSSLTAAPVISATTLASGSCESMFKNCTSLTTAPSTIGSSSTTIGARACVNMFSNCTSLTTAPELPATTLAENCYQSMFVGCTSLTTAPSILPATTLAVWCYNSMFGSCSTLKVAPELPATTLVENCYRQMFKDASKLNYIDCNATDTGATDCVWEWVYHVQNNSGTFVKNRSMNDWGTGTSGILSNWTVISKCDVDVTGVTINTDSTTITKGGTYALTATVLPNDACDTSVTWSTSDSSVATVSSEGLVTAIGCGDATITVTTTDGGYTAQCATSVINPVTGVSLNTIVLTILSGNTYQLVATTEPSDACGDKTVTWQSSNSNVATVSNNGLVTAVAYGSAVITATTTVGSYTATCAVEVTEPVAVTSVTLDESTLELVIGQTNTLTATVLPSNATDKAVTWSTSDSNVVTVSTGGSVTAISAGTATITVTTHDGGYTASCSVTVSEPSFTTLAIEGASSISAESCSYNAIADNIEDVTSSATWSITSGSQYATINSSNGEITILTGANESSVTIQAIYGILTATKNITLTYVSGATSETETESTTDIGGNTTTVTTTVTEFEDGSSVEVEETVVTDAEGNVIGTTESNTTTNADGSYNGNTVNYDASGNPTDGTNVTGDTDGNVSTQSVEYDESGNTIVTGYDIDTSETTGKTFNHDGVNTDYYAFDVTHGFILDFDFTIDLNNQPPSQDGNHHNVLNAKRADPSPWYGFQIRHTSTTGNTVFLGTQFSEGSNDNVALVETSTTGSVKTYNLRIVYDPTSTGTTFTCINTATQYEIFTSNLLFPDIEELKNLKVTIGYAVNSSGNPYRYSNITVHKFELKKLKNVANPTITCENNVVTIDCDTVGASVYYRLNLHGDYSAYTTSFTITADTVVQAYAVANGDTSDTIRQDCIFTVLDPVIACDGENVTITCATVGADIYYRLNESGSYSAYTASIPITADTVVESYAELNGTTSEIVKQTCIYSDTVYEPVITCTDNVVTITCATVGADIYYRLNESGTYSAYTTSFNIYEDTVVEAYSELGGKTSTTAKTSCVADYSKMYFTIRSLANSNTITLTKGGQTSNIEYYSTDNGENWTAIASGSGSKTIATLDSGDTMWIKCTTTKWGTAWDKRNILTGSQNFEVYGNSMSLIYGDNFIGQDVLSGTCAFAGLFYSSTKLISAESLILPGTTLAVSSYNGMFRGCSNLQKGPKLLPATTLYNDTYSSMFEGCTSLIEGPEIMATTIDSTGATTAMQRMFCMNRSSKVTAAMTKSPILRISNPNVASNTYKEFFKGNGNLVEVTILAQGTNLSFDNWLTNTNSSGVIKKLSTTTLTSGVNGIPSGWSTQNIDE